MKLAKIILLCVILYQMPERRAIFEGSYFVKCKIFIQLNANKQIVTCVKGLPTL